MKLQADQLKLYAITDRKWLEPGQTIASAVEEALRGGATIVQVREKNIDNREYEAIAKSIKSVTDRYDVPLIINDNPEVMLAVDADGVHIGQEDGIVKKVRALIGPDKILGASARTLEQALAAERDGADYLGCGAVFGTTTKSDAEKLSIDTLKEICDAVHIPVVAIGGITKDNLRELEGTGIVGAAVISAIFSKKNVEEASRELRQELADMHL